MGCLKYGLHGCTSRVVLLPGTTILKGLGVLRIGVLRAWGLKGLGTRRIVGFRGLGDQGFGLVGCPSQPVLLVGTTILEGLNSRA